MPSATSCPNARDRVLVGGRGAGHEEAAVAAARPARRRARLDDRAVDAALGQMPGAREAGDAGADHEHVGLVLGLERRALLVGIVVPEGQQRGHAGIVGRCRVGRSGERRPRNLRQVEQHFRIRRRAARIPEPPGRGQAVAARDRAAAAHGQPAAPHGRLVLDPARRLPGRPLPLPLVRRRLPRRRRRQRDRAGARRRPRQDLPHAHAAGGLDDADDPRRRCSSRRSSTSCSASRSSPSR